MLSVFFLTKRFSFITKLGFLIDFFCKIILNSLFKNVLIYSFFFFFEKLITENLLKYFFYTSNYNLNKSLVSFWGVTFKIFSLLLINTLILFFFFL
jgi:hypothetical protein